MIFVEFEFLHGAEWEAVDWPKVRENTPKDTPEEKPAHFPWFGSKAIRLTYDEATALTAAGLKLTIKPPPGAMMTKRQDDPAKSWEYGTRIEVPDLMSGAAVTVAVPDMALMYITEVCVETDFCTDALQDMLDEGWRILAVCPPNSQRRPDYVLGRRKNEDPFNAR